MPGGAAATGAGAFQSLQQPLGQLAPKDWLFHIPVQVGPATPHARSSYKWLFFILGIQAFLCFLRFVVLYDFTGGFWMLLTIALGLYAYRQDMNITYVCCWGIACSLAGTFDLLSLVLPWLFGMPFLGLLTTLVKMATPLAYGMGALFALHLYHDYEEAHGEKGMLSQLDPMGKYFENYDPEQIPLSASKGFDARFGTQTAGGVEKAQTGAYAAAGAAAGVGGAAAGAGSGLFGRLFGGGGPEAAASQGVSMAQEQMNVAGQQGADVPVFGRALAADGQDQARAAMAQGQQQLAQQQEAAKGWFGGMMGGADDHVKNAQGLATAGQVLAEGQLKQAQGQARSLATAGQVLYEEPARAALAQGQNQMAQQAQAAGGWFGNMQASAQKKAEEAAAAAAAEASKRAVAEGVQQGKAQASGFFSGVMGSAQQQGAAMQQQAGAQAMSFQHQGMAFQQQGNARFQSGFQAMAQR